MTARTRAGRRKQEEMPARDDALALLRAMLRIRRFEEKAAEMYQAGKIRGFLHLYIGEEAVAAGAIPVIAEEDNVVATYREHGHALMRGLPAGALMAEMFGKTNGCSGGHGGSMHFFDVSRRFFGGYAIVGGGLPIAVGLALADKMRGERRVTACFFGEGAVAEGEFHESLNLAQLWKLPVLFLCENNLYAMGTPLEQSESETHVTRKAASYGVEAESVDGMDVLATRDATQRALARIRETGQPALLEFQTYRFRGHSTADPELYRDKAEVQRWRERDPISLFEARLREWRMMTDDDVAAIERDVLEEVDEAVRYAEDGPLEPVEDLLRFVTTERRR